MSLISTAVLLKATEAVYSGDLSDLETEQLRAVESLLAGEEADSRNTVHELKIIRAELKRRAKDDK